MRGRDNKNKSGTRFGMEKPSIERSFDQGLKEPNNKPKYEKETEKKEEDIPNLSFTQTSNTCYCCGTTSHRSSKRRFKDNPKEEWMMINNDKNLKQHADNQTHAHVMGETKSILKTKSVGWAGVQFPSYIADEMRDVIILDNQSTETIFCNEKLVDNIRETDEILVLRTSAGVLETTMKANIPGWGDAWYNPSAVTNIFSFAEMARKHKITFDSKEEDAFIVHLPTKDVKFERTNEGLYVYRPNFKGH